MHAYLRIYRSQNDELRAEIEAQIASHKAQMGTLENRAHESWLAARQSERRCEEALAEAAGLRRKLTTMASGGADPVAVEAIAANGSGPVLGAELKTAPSPLPLPLPGLPGSPLLNMPNPLPFLAAPFSPFMGLPPPPFLPPAAGGGARPPPLGRMRSPPPSSRGDRDRDRDRDRYSDYSDYDDYDDDDEDERGAWIIAEGIAAAGAAIIATPIRIRRAHIARSPPRIVATTTMTRRRTLVHRRVRRQSLPIGARHLGHTARCKGRLFFPHNQVLPSILDSKTSSNIFINQRLSNERSGAADRTLKSMI